MRLVELVVLSRDLVRVCLVLDTRRLVADAKVLKIIGDLLLRDRCRLLTKLTILSQRPELAACNRIGRVVRQR